MAKMTRSRVAAEPVTPDEEYDERETEAAYEKPAAPAKRTTMRRPTGPITSGWGAPQAPRRETVKAPYLNLKNGKLIVHLLNDAPVVSYEQHFVNSVQRGYTCIQEKDGRDIVVFCPLCEAGHYAGQKYMMNVVDMSDPETVVAWTFGREVATLLQDHASEKRNFPLNREDLYFQVWRTKATGRYTNHATPLKAADIESDYDIEPLTAEDIATLNETLYGDEIVWINTESQLQKVADELTDKDLGN